MSSLMCTRPAAAGLVLALGLAMALPTVVQARAYDRGEEYDGYCYQREGSTGKGHPVTGAVVGGAIGSQVSKNERGLGTVAGAMIGAAVGSKVGKHHDDRCLDGEYYAFDGNYYDPPPPPEGYRTVMFRTRPSSDLYDHVNNNGHASRDDSRNNW